MEHGLISVFHPWLIVFALLLFKLKNLFPI